MSASQSASDGMSPRVLVVDDDMEIAHFIRGALEDEGLAVKTAADGRQAIAVADEFEPDLMILDVTLPVLSSHAVADHMRRVAWESVPYPGYYGGWPSRRKGATTWRVRISAEAVRPGPAGRASLAWLAPDFRLLIAASGTLSVV